jgi:hypothetical protein
VEGYAEFPQLLRVPLGEHFTQFREIQRVDHLITPEWTVDFR